METVINEAIKALAEKTKTVPSHEALHFSQAALNLAHELLALKNTPAGVAAALESESIQRRINSIEAKLDESLAQHEQLF